MPRKQTLVTHVDENGQIAHTPHRYQLRDMLALFSDGPVIITMQRTRRSLKANAYYWGVVLAAIQQGFQDVGKAYSTEALHEYFAAKYLPNRVLDTPGGSMILRPSTSTLDSTTFYYYVENVINDEAVLALGVEIDRPQEHGINQPVEAQ